ncbi:MAG: hypothetical protein BYD32DRAFT_92223 [Podila humilis]|nr:MAG: hypothetical protein BYD32DRAFT_92223 [Podila humilis]
MGRAVCSVLCVSSASVCECALFVVQSLFIYIRVFTLFLCFLYSASLVKVAVLEFKVSNRFPHATHLFKPGQTTPVVRVSLFFSFSSLHQNNSSHALSTTTHHHHPPPPPPPTNNNNSSSTPTTATTSTTLHTHILPHTHPHFISHHHSPTPPLLSHY